MLWLLPPNPIAIVVSVIAVQAFGALWYGFLFKEAWQRTLDKKLPPQSEWNLPKLHSLNIITDVLTAVVVTTLYKHLGITTFPAAFPYVFWLWLGLSAAPVFNAYGWGHRRLSFFLIETLHVFVSLLILTWVYFLVAWSSWMQLHVLNLSELLQLRDLKWRHFHRNAPDWFPFSVLLSLLYLLYFSYSIVYSSQCIDPKVNIPQEDSLSHGRQFNSIFLTGMANASLTKVTKISWGKMEVSESASDGTVQVKLYQDCKVWPTGPHHHL